MKLYLLRKLYEFTFWFGDKVAPKESNINLGYYTKFKKPSEIVDKDLVPELKRLCLAIRDSE